MEHHKPSVLRIALRQTWLLYQSKNPMFFIVLVLSCAATIIFLKQIYYQTDSISLYGQMTLWLWMTIFFSSIAQSIALSRNPNFYETIRNRREVFVKKVNSINDVNNCIKINKTKVKSGCLILLESSDKIPFDGEVVSGMCYVNEYDITGVPENILKSVNGDNLLVAGGIIESSDKIVMKVSFSSHKSFFVKATRLLEGIDRQAMPSEMALDRLMLGLSILFTTIVFIIWVIAGYFGLAIPMMYIIVLVVLLMPTTISALHTAVVYYGQAELAKNNIKVQDQVAFDNAIDLNVVLLDKTGTLTIGQREMFSFVPIIQILKKDYLMYLYLSSVGDNTTEGSSVISFVERAGLDKDIKDVINHIPFSASSPISGCNYKGAEIRKGSMRAIAKYLGIKMTDFPSNVIKASRAVAKMTGTPLLLTVDKTIIGIIDFRDKFRRGVIKEVKNMQDARMKVIMVTGDGALTASYMSKKLGIKSYYADQTPQKKLALIRLLQKKGYVVAMCGDGVNDALALAQADIGYTFEDKGHMHGILSGNIVSKHHNLSGLLELRRQCEKITVKRGVLTVYSISSDVAKYFVIVPSLFTTAFPVLNKLNIMGFASFESVILSSVIYNALVIPCLTPLIFRDIENLKNKLYLWRMIMLYGFGGAISPFVFIKLIELFICKVGLI